MELRYLQLLRIALHNVLRNRRRTILTLAVLILGSAGLLMVGGYFEGILSSYREQYIHGLTGHLQVNQMGFRDNGASDPFAYLLPQAAAVQALMAESPQVRVVVPHLKVTGLLSSETTGISVIGLGVDAQNERRMNTVGSEVSGRNTPMRIIQGDDLSSDDPQGIVLGKGLMKTLGVKIGDTLTLITSNKEGSIDGGEFHARGVFETIVKDFDDQGIKLNLAAAQKVMGLTDEVHQILVVLDKTHQVAPVQSEFSNRFAERKMDLEIIPWDKVEGYYEKGRVLLNTIYMTIQAVVITVFFFSMANTINMALFERVREFGTMMAIGNSRGVVFAIIFLETSFLGLMGTFLGVISGLGLGGLVTLAGLEMPPVPGSNLVSLVTITATNPLLFQTALITAGTTAIACLLPGYRASHMPIVKALGYV